MKKSRLIKNSTLGIVSQCGIMLLGFFSQRIFLHYLGVEYQGVNGVISNILNMLSLAELGIGSAITYRLYRPLEVGDEVEIASLMLAYKKMYRLIGLVILVLGLGLMYSLPLFINDTTLPNYYLRIIFLIQLASTLSTYFLAYKRTLLYADQNQYVCTLSDTVSNVLFTVLRIIFILLFKNYLIYLALQLFQTIFSNLVIEIYCRKKYTYIYQKDIKPYGNYHAFFVDVKNILFGKIAVYIYGSTDNLVISYFLGVVSVGLMSNYYYVLNAVKSIISSFFYPVTPAIGNYINSDHASLTGAEELLYLYTAVRYSVALIVNVGLIVCCNMLIGLFFGQEYVLNRVIIILLCVDLFISMVYGPLGEFNNILGYFQYEKYIHATGAIINIVSSIIFVQFMGLSGVLIGTCISQMFFWISKSILLYRLYLKKNPWMYWLKIIELIGVFLGVLFLNLILQRYLYSDMSWRNFIISVFACLLTSGVVILIFCIKNPIFKRIFYIALNYLERK